MFGFGFMKKRHNTNIEKAAQVELADHLINWGFTPSEAIKISEGFWNKYRGKLESVV